MKRATFEYTTMILSKVSFDPNLFCKELKKAIDRLLPYEIEELKVWLDDYTKNKPELMQCMVLMDKYSKSPDKENNSSHREIA